jgi:hypothetical protein
VTLSSADLQARGADNGVVGKKKRGPGADRPKRRSFTPEFKLAIVEEYERLSEPGARGALPPKYAFSFGSAPTSRTGRPDRCRDKARRGKKTASNSETVTTPACGRIRR